MGLGVSASNWTRVMEMDTNLDRRGLSKKKDSKSKTQLGQLYYDPFSKSQISRNLLEGLDMDALTYRNEDEERAYGLAYFPEDALTYSRTNSAVSAMRTFPNMPNSIKDIQKLSETIEQ